MEDDTTKIVKKKEAAKIRIGAEMLLRLLEIPDSLIKEATFSINREGLRIALVDNAHVAMVNMGAAKSLFEDFSYESDESSEYGINVENLKKMLKSKFASKSMITMVFDSKPSVDQRGQPFREHFIDLQIKKGNYSKNHHIKQVDTATISVPKIPKLNLPLAIEIRSIGDMLEILDSIRKEKYDHIVVHSKSDNALFITFGDEAKGKPHNNMVSFDGNATVLRGGPTDMQGKEVGVQGYEYKSIFPLDYLYNIFRALTYTFGKNTKAVIMIGNDYPIEVTCYNPVVQATYLLAPRIESD